MITTRDAADYEQIRQRLVINLVNQEGLNAKDIMQRTDTLIDYLKKRKKEAVEEELIDTLNHVIESDTKYFDARDGSEDFKNGELSSLKWVVQMLEEKQIDEYKRNKNKEEYK